VTTEKSILRLPAVMAKTGYKRSTVYKSIKDGTFPEPIKLGPQSVGWLASEIDAWIDARIKATRSAA